MKKCVECGEPDQELLLILNTDIVCMDCASCGCMEWSEEDKLTNADKRPHRKLEQFKDY